MYYKNHDYTVWMRIIDGYEKYFIKFHGQVHGQADSAAIEISRDIFDTYLREFNKPLEKQRNEKRRHLEADDINDFIMSGELTTLQFEKEIISKTDIYIALKACTNIQRKRFILHHIQGYSFTEIAKMEQCNEAAVRRSVSAALKKVKKYFER